MADIIIKNRHFTLTLGEDCAAKSLRYTPEGKPAVECLKQDEHTPMFSITEDRPYNNEIKLAYPNREITMQANRVRQEGNNLIVGFELVGFEAIVEYKVADDYISFKFIDFIVKPEHFGNLCMTPPPVAKFRMIQLPVKTRQRFGEWLNVMWDDEVAVNVLATCPEALVNGEVRKGYRIMSADAHRGIKLRGCEAALIVTAPDKLLDCIESVEEDYDLPRGVASRRSEYINRSSFFVNDFYLETVDKHIEYAKKSGITMFHVYYPNLVTGKNLEGRPRLSYCSLGDYLYRQDRYPGGAADVKAVLDKCHDAGIKVGLHFLHTHIGVYSEYVLPSVDHRLNLTRHFTLAKPISADDTVIYIEENPVDTEMDEMRRILRFGGEIIKFESYTTEYPYCFKGCKRGYYESAATAHPMGQIGGLLDITEFGGGSVYLNQNSSLQEEIADKIMAIYNIGFDYIYFDGSEGTDAPFDYNVSNAQYRVYKKAKNKPLYCEGAAKSHFGWHMISGGNAFDVFLVNEFKEMLIEHPFKEIQRTVNDFTRINFGWWNYTAKFQPDIYEFGTGKAAAWDCPITLISDFGGWESNPRTDDNAEVLRRWEDVRRRKLLTEEMRAELKKADVEHILLINESGEYELVPYKHLPEAAGGDENVRAFTFTRVGKACAVIWHTTGAGKLLLPLSADKYIYETEIGKKDMTVTADGENSIIALDRRRYIIADCTEAELVAALKDSKLI